MTFYYIKVCFCTSYRFKYKKHLNDGQAVKAEKLSIIWVKINISFDGITLQIFNKVTDGHVMSYDLEGNLKLKEYQQ